MSSTVPLSALSPEAFLRVQQIIGDPKQGIPPLIPVSASTWWAGVKSGRFPKQIKLGLKTSVWRVRDIVAYLESQEVQP